MPIEARGGLCWSVSEMRILSVLVVCVGLVLLCGRGTLRATQNGHDLQILYAGAASWVDGGDPYTANDSLYALEARGGQANQPSANEYFRLLYPPTTFVAVAPLTYLSWSSARNLVAVLNTAAVILVALGVLRMACCRKRLHPLEASFLVAIVLAFAPSMTSLALGQPAPIVTCIGLWACIFARRDGTPASALGSGAVLGWAFLVKPQLAAAFCLFLLIDRRWTGAAAALGVVSLGLVASVLRLEGSSPRWLANWRSNVTGFRGLGEHPWINAVGSSGTDNPMAWQLIHLEPLLIRLGSDPEFAGRWAVLFAALLAGIASVRALRNPRPDRGLLLLSGLVVCQLLVGYHRTYDAVAMLVPFLWAVGSWGRPGGWPRVVVLICTLGFLLPGSAAIYAAESLISTLLARPIGFHPIIGFHANILVLLCGVALAVEVGRRVTPSGEHLEASAQHARDRSARV